MVERANIKRQSLWDLKKRYEDTEKLGIPADTDLFYEFANLPANCPTTLARETQALIGMDLIDPEYKKFPLHVTVGGITFENEEGYKEESNTHLLARILDATAWETNGERLLAPYEGRDTDWTQHAAVSGIRERDQDIIKSVSGQTAEHAVELRTLQLQSIFGLDRYLRSSYYLGSALKAYQNPDKSDPVIKKLSKVWMQFSDRCSDLFDANHLPDPLKPWTLDTMNPDAPSEFRILAKVLDKGLEEPESKEAKFIHDMRLLIIQTRAEVKEIIE